MLQKKSALVIVSLIAVIAIAFAMCFSMFSIGSNNNTEIQSVEYSNANTSSIVWGPSNAGGIGYESKGDGLEDGLVYNQSEEKNYIKAMKYSEANSGWTPISSASELSNALRKNTNSSYYLTTNINWTTGYVEDSSTFTGTIDGCGKTVNLTCDYNVDSKTEKDYSIGFMTGNFNGTLKNVTINIVKARFKRGRNKDGYRVNNNMTFGLFGYNANGGVLSNVKIIFNNQVNSSEQNYTEIGGINVKDKEITAGLIFGKSNKSTISNVTVELKNNIKFNTQTNWNRDNDLCYGIFAGNANTNTTILKNITIRGEKNISQNDNDGRGNNRLSAFVGEVTSNGTLTIDGVDLGGWTGVITRNPNSGPTGLFLGNGSKSSGVNVTINNILYRNDANNAYVTKANMWYVGDNETFSIGNANQYESEETKIGFCHSDDSKIWIGGLSDLERNGINTTGGFVDTVKIGDQSYLTGEIASGGVTDRTIPIIPKASINKNISYTFEGQYAYSADEFNVLEQSAGPELSLTGKNSAEGIYNGNKLSGLIVDSEVYIGGNIQPELNGKVRIDNLADQSAIENANVSSGVQTISATKEGGILVDNKYYIIYAPSYHLDITINPAKAEFSDSGAIADYVYTGNVLYNSANSGDSNKGLTTEGKNYINALIRSWQTKPTTKLDYVSLFLGGSIELIFKDGSDNNVSTIKDVGSYKIIINKVGTGSGNFEVQSGTTITFNIVSLSFDFKWQNLSGNSNFINLDEFNTETAIRSDFNNIRTNPFDILSIGTNVVFDKNEISKIEVIDKNGKTGNIKITTSQGNWYTVPSSFAITYKDKSDATNNDRENICDAGEYSVSFGSTSVGNNISASSTTSPLKFYIEQSKLIITFDDTKTLYDSILDVYHTTYNYYDFIYAQGDSRIDQFSNNYSKYFTKVAFFNENGQRVDYNFSDYLVISNQQHISANTSISSADKAHTLKLEWKDGVNPVIKNNFIIEGTSELDYTYVNYITTGASRNTAVDQDGIRGISSYNWGEDAISTEGTAFVRLLLVKNSEGTGTDHVGTGSNFCGDSLDIIGWNENYSSVGIFNYINSRYYDGNSLSKITKYKLQENIYLDRPYTSGRILPSYKTIDGEGYGIFYYWRGELGSEAVGYSEVGGKTKPLTDGKYTASESNNTFNNEYRGYANINGIQTYGIGMLLAVNYGILQNIYLYTYMDRIPLGGIDVDGRNQDLKQWITALPNVQTAIGNVVGINKGIIGTKTGNTINAVEVYQAREQYVLGKGSALSYGGVAGANDGVMQYVYCKTPSVVRDNWNNGGEDEYPSTNIGTSDATNFPVSATTVYFGVITGINDKNGKIYNLDYTSRYNGDSGLTVPSSKHGRYKVSAGNTERSITIETKHANTSREKFGLFTSATTHYMGIIAGYHAGVIQKATIINQAVFASQNATNVYLGGVAGYTKGNGDNESGVIQNCKVTNQGTIIGGNADVAMSSYAVGGITGVTNGGNINNCGFVNSSGAIINALSSARSSNGLSLGGLVGIGCEEGTVDDSHPMNHNGEKIKEGKLTKSTSFNFGTFSAQYGGWGYIAGRYNTILSGSDGTQPAGDSNNYDYVHRYGDLIWYTSNTPNGYQKKVFDGIAGIMGENSGLGSGSDNVYITGLAGVGITDCGDGYVGSLMLNTIVLDGDYILVYYNAPNALSGSSYTGYQAMDASIVLEDGTEKAVAINKNPSENGLENAEKNLSEGGYFKFRSEDAKAIIKSTKTPATSCDVKARLYALINNDPEYKSFIGDEKTASTKAGWVPGDTRGEGKYNRYIYCAGYGILGADIKINTNQVNSDGSLNNFGTNIVLSSKKTLRGTSLDFNRPYDSTARTFPDGTNKYKITYIYPRSEKGSTLDATYDESSNQVTNGTNYLNVYSIGNLVGRNEGVIEKMTIRLDPTEHYNSNQAFRITAEKMVAYGAICGINHGVLRDNKVEIANNVEVIVNNSSGTTAALVGGLCGINDRGQVIRNEVHFVDSTKNSLRGSLVVSNINSDQTSYAFLGGAIGVSNGGIVKGLTVQGYGYVSTTKGSVFTYANIGGAVGYMPLVNNLTIAGFTLLPVTEVGAETDNINGINVALMGGVKCWNSINGGVGLVFGRIVNTLDQAADLATRILNAKITAVCLGDVDAFQISGRYESSLYGIADGYSKDQTAAKDIAKHVLATNTNRIVLQDGSEYGRGFEAIVSSLSLAYSGSNYIMSSFTVTFNWSTTGIVGHSTPTGGSKVGFSGSDSVNDTGASFTGLGRSDTSRGYYYILNVSYSVNISAETETSDEKTWQNAYWIYDSPFMNFVSGRGSKSVYAGATIGNLQGDIIYNKKVSASIEMTSRKTLNGGNHTFYSYWIGSETGNQIAGLTEDTIANGGSIGQNDISNVGEYPKWYEGRNGNIVTKVYGISDFISINRGTINNLNVSSKAEATRHYYTGLVGAGANVGYGSFCGVNLGNINNCQVILTTNTKFLYTSTEPTCDLLVSPGVGLNRGSIDGFKIEMNNAYEIAGIAKNVTMGGAVALNGINSTLKNAEVIINGSFNRTVKTYDPSIEGIKDNSDGAVTFGGIVGVNDGGAIQYTKISGKGTINVSNRGYDVSGVEKVQQEVTDANGNKTTIEVEVEKSRFYEDTKYLFFAIGVAISNNQKGTMPTYAGHAIHDCVDSSGNNKVHDMILLFSGNLFYTTKGNYMIGLAFAKASETVVESANSPAYKNIFISNEYSTYSELVHEGTYRTEGIYDGYVIGAALPLMGHVGVTSNPANTSFVKGGRVDANADISIDFGTNGSLVITTKDQNVTKLTSVILEELPLNERIRAYTTNDASYLTFTQGTDPNDLSKKIAVLTLSANLLAEAFNNNGCLTQIYVEYYFPTVEINDVFQLAQFMRFDPVTATAASVKSSYVETYKDEIIKLANAGQKQFTASKPYGVAWANTSDRTEVLKYYSTDDIYEYNGKLLLVEKALVDNVAVYYYAALRGMLKADIVLNEYTYNSGNSTIDVNLGWSTTQHFELAEDKILDGEKTDVNDSKYDITIVATTFENWKGTLSDVMHTPAVDTPTYIAGGFVGVNRGIIRNIDFIFKEGSTISIATNDFASPLDLRNSIFAGIVSGYNPGTIDSCTLKMEDNTQVYIFKFDDETAPSNNSKYSTNLLGGFTGLLGKGAVISNSTLTMGDNAVLALNARGKTNLAGSRGSIFNYVGGFAGMMAYRSYMYNLKIEGSESSLLAAVGSTDNSGDFNNFFAAVGGVVGCNSSDTGLWNPKEVGSGTIDGVIFNWKGACLNTFWLYDGWGGTTAGGNRDAMTVTYYGGSCIGVTDANAATNFYYTFDISTFGKTFAEDFTNGTAKGTGIYIHKRNKEWRLETKYSPSLTYYTKNGSDYTKVEGLTKEKFEQNKYYTPRSHFLNINLAGKNKFDTTNTYAVCMSDVLAGLGGNKAITTKTLRVFEMTNHSVPGTGITFTSGSSIVDEKYTANLNISNFNATGYTELSTLGDVLQWADETVGSDILCSFEVKSEDTSAVMWSINIYGAKTEGNKLRDSKNTVTEIPVYKFAKTINEAMTYKKFNYQIQRGEGNGMNLYYCTGNAAILSPNKNYYANIGGDKTIYHPKKAVMYDGKTDASNIAVNIYNQYGEPISRLTSDISKNIFDKAKADKRINTIISTKNESGNYVQTAEDADLKMVGSYRIEYQIKSYINPNAYVSEAYRTAFFSSEGEEAVNELVEDYFIYIVIAPISIDITKIQKKYDGSKDIQYEKDKVINPSTIEASIVHQFTYIPDTVTSPTITSSNGYISLSSNSSVQLKIDGTYDSAEAGDREATIKIGGNITYSIYEYRPILRKWVEKKVTSYYIADKSGKTTTYFTLQELSTLQGNEATVEKAEEIYGYADASSLQNGFLLPKKTGRTIKIVKAEKPEITVKIPDQKYTYTGSNIVLGVELAQYITMLDGFKQPVSQDEIKEMIRSGALVISIGEAQIKDVVESGYSLTVTISYVGLNMENASTTTTMRVYVIPKQITIKKVIKEYDGTTDTTSSTFVISGLIAPDTNTGITATYTTVDVGKSIVVNITNTQSITIKGTAYKTLFTNYHISSTTPNVGIIYPAKASIENAFKEYDGTNTLTYSASGTTTATKTLIKPITGKAGEKLDYKLTGSYSSSQVGQCNLTVDLEEFSYVDANNATKILYRIKNSGAATNYCIAEATSTSFTKEGIAYITPKEVSISYVEKEYDGTDTLGTFIGLTGLLSQDSSITKFDGVYSSSNVVYSSGNYNNVILTATSYKYEYCDSSSKITDTVYRLVKDGTATNYMLASGDGITLGTQCIISGKGVIIPKLIELKKVTKIYDGKERFNSAEKGTDATVVINGAEDTTFIVTGKMSGKNATNGENLYDVILENTGSYKDYTPFRYNNKEYVWLNTANNSNKNYRFASTTISKVGDVVMRKLDIVTGSTTSEGALYNLRFSTSKLGERSVFNGTEYMKGQTYSTTNFIADLKFNGETKTLRNGAITIDGVTMNFELDKTAENAGTYTFKIKMTTTLTNFTFEEKTFSFEIRKKVITDSSLVSVVIPDMSKTYDGTSNVTNVSVGTISNFRLIAEAVSGTDTVTSWSSASVTSTGGVGNKGISMLNPQTNAGTYTPNLSLTVSLYNANYSFTGTITNVYNNTSYSTKTAYIINPYTLIVSGTFEKAFDGSTAGKIQVNGVAGEVLNLTYTSDAIKAMPGSYTGNASYTVSSIDVSKATNKSSNKDNYKVDSSSITVNVANAKVVLERQYKNTNTGVNYFATKLALLNLKGLDMFVSETCTADMLNTFITNKTLDNDTNKDAIKAAIAQFFMINVNDSPLWSTLTASQIDNALIYETGTDNKTYTLELAILGATNINTETNTDRIAMVMFNSATESETIESKYCSNISVSSSELAEGQFSGVYTTTGTAISTPDKLKDIIQQNGTGYLTNNIYGFDNTAETGSTFTGTIYGNGYTITLNGGLNAGTNSGYFLAVNNGTLQDINFKFVSTLQISDEVKNPIGMVVGTNGGTIKNCSLEIVHSINMKEGSTLAEFAGIAVVNTGTIENVAVIYSTAITNTVFSGIVSQSSVDSTLNYVAVRENKFAKISEITGYTIGKDVKCTIAYAIDALSAIHTNTTATITKLYGDSTTKLSMFSDTYKEGYIDYYFTKLETVNTALTGKYLTNGNLHNIYETEGDVNKSYYYGYDNTKKDVYRIAIETIAPLNRFIWEAYDANYLTYGTSLNRTVALFDLSVTLQDNAETAKCELDTSITFITSTTQEGKKVWVTIFNPAIGIIAEAVISSGVDTIQEHEYTGSPISASFTATIGSDTKVLTITGTEVGVYTEYFEEANKEVNLTSREFDAATRTAKILSSSGGTGSATIMLIITPKTITNAPTTEKQYDSTNIAETAISTDSDSADEIYAIGEYSNANVGTGYSVSYYSYTRPVAAQVVNGVYKFIKCYLSGMDAVSRKKIYTVKYSSLASNTDISTIENKVLAREYNQLVTLEYIKSLETANNIVNYGELSNVTNSSGLTTAYIYDLAFGYNVDANKKVTYTSEKYLAYTMFNVSLDRDAQKTINANYKWVPTDKYLAFSGTSLIVSGKAEEQSYNAKEVATNGIITKRTIDARYSNLDQSYRGELSAITIAIDQVENLTNIPYSLSTAQYNALITAINNELKNAKFTADVIGETIKDGSDVIKKENEKYYAINQKYAEVALVALTGNYSVSANLAVNISGGATLKLRYFAYDNTSKSFIIDSLEALKKIDSGSEENLVAEKPHDYQTLNYIVTKDINAKSALVTSFVNVFNGTINGNGKKISNLVLVGTSSTSLFGTLGANAEIYNLSIINTVVIVTADNATASIVTTTNNASEKGIHEVNAEGYVFSVANNVTIAPISINGTGKTSANKAFVQTNRAVSGTTIATLSNDTSSELVVMFRAYGNMTVANNIVNIYINGVADKTYANITGNTQTFIKECIINAPLTINAEGKVVTNNFRQYWAYINICPWLSATNPTGFIGHEFEIGA